MAGWGLGTLVGGSAVTYVPEQGFLIWALWTLLKISTTILNILYKNCIWAFFWSEGPCLHWIRRRVSVPGLTSGLSTTKGSEVT